MHALVGSWDTLPLSSSLPLLAGARRSEPEPGGWVGEERASPPFLQVGSLSRPPSLCMLCVFLVAGLGFADCAAARGKVDLWVQDLWVAALSRLAGARAEQDEPARRARAPHLLRRSRFA